LSRIIVLDELTANRIAAGEVIERPASVVKELVENSLDAGSTHIDIEVAGGGLKLIQVTDDGTGISREDAALAFERHATSKIREATDLDSVGTFGFRGEALPSIASVARGELVTRPGDKLEGAMVAFSGGRLTELQDAGAPVGTRVVVRDLFFNTPARLKYLKSQAAETTQIVDVVYRLALANPGVSFRMTAEGRLILTTMGNNRVEDALAAIFGQELARETIRMDVSGSSPGIHGLIGKPEIARAGRQYQFFSVNGRVVKNRALGQAVEAAYRTLLPRHRYPFVVLDLTLPPAVVDVNVHPAKLEVRFQADRAVTDAVYAAVRRALKEVELIPRFDAGVVTGGINAGPGQAGPLPGGPMADEQETGETEHGRANPGTFLREAVMFPEYAVRSSGPGEPAAADSGSRGLFGAETDGESSEASFHLVPLGQVFRTYIVAEADQLYLVDQHAAHERILYEDILSRSGSTEVPSQEVLIPEEITVSFRERETLVNNIVTLRDLGFVVEEFGGNSFLLRAVPVYLIGEGVPFFREVLDLLEEESRGTSPAEIRDKVFQMAACRSAIKAGDTLRMPEMVQLLARLAACDNPYTCPHGRPTLVSLGRDELARRFKRL